MSIPAPQPQRKGSDHAHPAAITDRAIEVRRSLDACEPAAVTDPVAIVAVSQVYNHEHASRPASHPDTRHDAADAAHALRSARDAGRSLGLEDILTEANGTSTSSWTMGCRGNPRSR